MVNLVIKSSSFGKFSSCIQEFKKLNINFINSREDKDYKFLINNADILILDTSNLNRIIKKTKKLKYIYRIGKGIDNLDLELLKEKKIKYKCFYDDISNSVSELILSLILNLARRINISDNMIKNNMWAKLNGYTLNELKVGFLGFGDIAFNSALKLSKITKNNIYYYDNDRNKKIILKNKFKYLSLRSLFKECDVISINIPYTNDTKNLINKKLFSLTKKNFMMVNTSRGGIVNENDLYEHLKKNKESYVAMDVFKKEPYYGNLCKLNNIILTPHIGSLTNEFRSKVELNILKEIKKYV